MRSVLAAMLRVQGGVGVFGEEGLGFRWASGLKAGGLSLISDTVYLRPQTYSPGASSADPSERAFFP